MKARKISIFIIFCMLVSLFFVFDTETNAVNVPTISIGSAVGRVGDRVTVPVFVENNPGVVGVFLDITYDSDKLSLVDVTDTGLLSGGFFSEKLEQNPFALTWEDSLAPNNMCNGVIATLTFEILEDCENETIELSSPRKIMNYDLDFVQFDLIPGTIALTRPIVPISGITLCQPQTNLDPGETLAIPVCIVPDNATNKELHWTSSDDTVATVSPMGEVTALRSGTTTITAAATDGSGITEACTIHVVIGDIDKDGYVNTDDVVLLMQYSMLPSLYPIPYKGNVDFNHDGSVDSLDVVMLMQYSILPELYPLD